MSEISGASKTGICVYEKGGKIPPYPKLLLIMDALLCGDEEREEAFIRVTHDLYERWRSRA